MTARDWTEELTAYIDGALDPETVKALEAQLASDPALRALEQRLRKTVARVAELSAPEPSPALRRAVLSRLDEPPSLWARLVGLLSEGRLVPVGALAAVGVVVIIAVTGGDLSRGPDSEEQLFVAQHMEMLEDYDVLGLDGADDLDVVAQLHELKEATP